MVAQPRRLDRDTTQYEIDGACPFFYGYQIVSARRNGTLDFSMFRTLSQKENHTVIPTTIAYTHVLNCGGLAVGSPADKL